MGRFVRPCRELGGIPSGGIVVTRILLLTLALATLVGVAGASAQQRQITGQVTSAATREAVAGVNVSVTGTAFAAVTNSDGSYAIPEIGRASCRKECRSRVSADHLQKKVNRNISDA